MSPHAVPPGPAAPHAGGLTPRIAQNWTYAFIMTNAMNSWAALADPTRRTIYERLIDHPSAGNELAAELPVGPHAWPRVDFGEVGHTGVPGGFAGQHSRPGIIRIGDGERRLAVAILGS